MANKVTENDIIRMNELYLEHKTYAAVSRIVGFSASTVKKYIQKDYVSEKDRKIKKFDKVIYHIKDNPNKDEILNVFKKRNWNLLSVLSTEEEKEIKELQKEILV